MPGASILETLQKIATVVHRLDVLAEDLRELRTAVKDWKDRWLTFVNGLPGWKPLARLIVPKCKLIWHASALR